MKNKNILILIGLVLISLYLIVSTIAADNGTEVTSLINYSNKGNSNFNLPSGMAAGAARTDGATNIRATKEISASDKRNSPDIKLTIEMPPKPAKLDIVLAMDTSGSMVQHYQDNNPSTTYLDWASKTIAPIVEKYPDARISIASWDDEDETGDSISPFYNASGDRLAVENKLKSLSQECLETDHTVYSVGVKRAVQVLDNNWPEDPYNTARIIIFVTGLSEFRAEPKNASKGTTLDEQLKMARQNRTYGRPVNFSGYQIFPVQIGIDSGRFKWQYNNLSKILNNTRIDGQSILKEPISIEKINDLDSAIGKILEVLKSRPVAHDVKVIDTLYPYLKYLGSDTKYLTYSGSESNRQTPIQMVNSSDGSTTLSWNIGAMNSSEKWIASIHSKLNLSLPVEVSLNKPERQYEIAKIANTTPVSEVKYVWMTGYKGIISLPEGKVVLSSGDSTAERNSISQAPKEQPGFEAYSAVAGIMFVTFLLGKRKKLRTS